MIKNLKELRENIKRDIEILYSNINMNLHVYQ